MRRIVHLSDLHFGRVDPDLITPLIEAVRAVDPHLVAVSGDLTQRARSSQFQDARKFLDRLPFPQIVVPGNHDIPLHNLLARFGWSLKRYRRYISDDLAPFFEDEQLAVAGVNTARALTTKYGRISDRQLARLAARFGDVRPEVTKILVTHHPFDLPTGYENERQLLGRSEVAMAVLATSGVDLVLSGHLHLTHAVLTTARYKIAGYSALLVQAGTAISTRGRGEANSFNILEVEPGAITAVTMAWQEEARRFTSVTRVPFRRMADGWQPLTDVVAVPAP